MIILDETSPETECKKINLYSHQKKVLHYILKRELQIIRDKTFFKKLPTNIIENLFGFIESTNSYKESFIDEMNSHFENIIQNYAEIGENNLNIKLPVGAGKSYITLSIIDAFPTYKERFINIIIVPTKLVGQWEKYINIFKPDSKVIVLNTYKKCEEFAPNANEFEPKGVLVLISNTMINYVNLKLAKLMRIFIDELSVIEGRTIREIRNSKKALFTYSTCASWYETEYITVKKEVIINSIKLPEINFITKIVKNRIYKFLLTLNCTESTIRKFDIDLFKTTSDLFKEVFEEKVEIKEKKIKLLESTKKDEEKERLTQEINQLDTEINSLKERILNENCLICMKTIFKPKRTSKKTGATKPERCPILLLCCKISICNECIVKINKCVYCKKEFEENKENDSFRAKFKEICSLKSKFNENSKVVLIGNEYHKLNSEMLEEISRSLFGNKKHLRSLEGASSVCNKRLENFRNKNLIKILYFPDASKVIGFNMEFVTDLILMDNLNAVFKNQVIGRFQRNGRNKSLNVYEFIYQRS